MCGKSEILSHEEVKFITLKNSRSMGGNVIAKDYKAFSVANDDWMDATDTATLAVRCCSYARHGFWPY